MSPKVLSDGPDMFIRPLETRLMNTGISRGRLTPDGGGWRPSHASVNGVTVQRLGVILQLQGATSARDTLRCCIVFPPERRICFAQMVSGVYGDVSIRNPVQ